MPLRTPLRTAFAAVAFCCAFAVPAWSYTIFLKDGSKLLAEQKYTVRGDKAIIKLESGTETMLPLSEIDLPRTEAANQGNLGKALVIEDGKAQNLTRNDAPPPRKQTLQDLIQSRAAQAEAGNAAAAPAPARRQRADSQQLRSDEIVGRPPLRNVELAGEIRTFLFGRGVTSVEVLQGSTARSPLLVFATATEGQVFKALAASASALIHVRENGSNAVDSFDVFCRENDGARAGRFSMTPAHAADLLAKRITLAEYFVQNVQF